MESMVKKATKKDIPSLYKILQKTTFWLQKQGWHHWDNYYTINKIKHNMKVGKIFILYYKKKPIGTICIKEVPDNDYWKDKKRAIYFSGLAILPKYHKKGFGKYLLNIVIEHAKKKNFKLIRFDALGNSKELTQYYLRWGAKIIGYVGNKKTIYGNLYEKRV